MLGCALLLLAGCSASSKPSAVGSPTPAATSATASPAASATAGATACATEAETVVTDLSHPTSIVSDGTNLYWINNPPDDLSGRSLMRVGVSGGEPVTLAAHLRDPAYLAVDKARVYWIDSGKDFPHSPQILSVPLAGGTPKPLVANDVSRQQFVVVGGRAYYFGGSVLHRVSTTGGTPTKVSTLPNNAFNATADAANLYWTDDHQHVYKLPFAGGRPILLTTLVAPADFLGLSQPIAVDATGVYAPANPGKGTDAVLRIPLAGGAPTEVASFASAYNGVAGIVSDGTTVYWANSSGLAVQRAPVTGGTAETVSCDQARPNGITRDASAIYWTTDAGSIERLTS
jgi:hypothetical protein